MGKKDDKVKKIEAIVDGIAKGTNKYSAEEENMDRDTARIESSIDGMNRGAIAKIWDNVMVLLEALKDPDVPVAKKLVIIGALIYAISPLDAVPDVIPVVGLLDDVGVIMLVFKQMGNLINTVKNKVVEAAAEAKKQAIEAAAETAAIQTKEHLRRLRISLIVGIVVAALAIIVAVTIRLINTV